MQRFHSHSFYSMLYYANIKKAKNLERFEKKAQICLFTGDMISYVEILIKLQNNLQKLKVILVRWQSSRSIHKNEMDLQILAISK